MIQLKHQWSGLTGALLLSSLVSVGLFIGRVGRNHNDAYFYMVWNLFLAWIPLLLTLCLLKVLRRKVWSSWQGIGLSLLWLGFLPNSFYVVSDFIHLTDTASVDIIYDAVMLMSFALNGLVLGYLSLYLFHAQLRRRLPRTDTAAILAAILLMCSFAIYMGRDLRWNTWDVLLNPGGILFDVSDRILHPSAYPEMFVTVGVFFTLLITFYYCIWHILSVVRGATAAPGKDLML